MAEAATAPAAFVVGNPIGHSRSPLIHRHWLAEHGIAGSYEAVDVATADLPAFLERLRRPDSLYRGGNVTLPHKEAACRLADRVDDLAAELGAANTLWLEDGRLCATNTDMHGFLANLDARRPGWCRPERPAVVLGAGGASRAVLRGLIERGYGEIHLVNRTHGRARELADRFGSRVIAHDMAALDEVAIGAALFVNTTSLGMNGAPLPRLDFSRLDRAATVSDLVYVPLTTPILKLAAASGLATVDGLGMLLHQAVPGFEKWFGVRPTVTPDLRRSIMADIEAHP